ncbi:hypothetical protein, partial [uncultured Duncaniella sp.]|uniref:hypothetical protein n=1 Tax=uncultured Duncaniella sp. TaxID=2768039 RepID=UPI0025B716AC
FKEIRQGMNDGDARNFIPKARQREAVPADAPEGFKPVTAYAYTGPEDDGGTLIEAADDSRDSLINGVIRSRYSQTEEDAIKTHQILALTNPGHDKAADYASEWARFNIEREDAIKTVDSWFE